MVGDYIILVLIAVFVVGGIVSGVYAHKMLHILQDEGVEASVLSFFIFPQFMHEYRRFLQKLTDREKRQKYSKVYRQACLWRNIALIAFAVMFIVMFFSLFR